MAGRWRYVALVPGAIAAPFLIVLAVEPAREGPESLIWFAAYFAWYVSGATAFVCRPELPAARRMLFLGTAMMFWGVVGLGIGHTIVAGHSPGWPAVTLLHALDLMVPGALLALLAVYPDRHGGNDRLVRGWFVLAAGLPILLLLTRATLQEPLFVVWLEGYVNTWPAVDSPVAIAQLDWLGQALGPFAVYVFNAGILAAVALFALHYRRAPAADRVLLAWPLYAAWVTALAGGLDLVLFAGGARQPLMGWLAGAALVALPVAVAVGLLRPHVFDIQRVLRRSLVYGAVWLLVGAIYVGATAAVGIAAAQAHVEVAVAVTIMASLLFQPVRRLLQRRARVLVFGRGTSRDELLRRFGATLEHTLEPGELTAAVAATVHEALVVAWVRIRVDGQVMAAHGIEPSDPRPAATAADLGQGLGSIECGPRAQGRWDAADRELLAGLGRQTGLALRNARLAEELSGRLGQIRAQADSLAASRVRIVQAEETARRDIERDIHDGVQQELVALMARLALARRQLARDPGLVHETLVELQGEASQALDDLRELARGIHPSVLTDRGIVDAIEGRAARLPIGVTIECDPGMRERRFPESVEAAVYFLVSEGCANALKHSRAERVIVRLYEHEGELTAEVSDDGTGFDPTAAGAGGLSGLADRFDALGGTVQVDSAPGAGTRLTARLGTGEHSAV